MAQNRRRRHHTVPRFYLEGFASGGQVRTVELPGVKRFNQSTGNASAITDFYTLYDENGQPSDVIEAAFGEIEQLVAPTLAGVIHKGVWPLAGADREAVAMWLAVQYVRGPDYRRQVEQISAAFSKMEISMGGRDALRATARERVGRDITDDELDVLWAQATSREGPPIELTALGHARQIGETLPEIYPYFYRRHWSVVRFARKSLLTCDTPVSLVPDWHSPEEGVGLLTAWAIAVPLSRRVALLLKAPASDLEFETEPGDADVELPASTELARMFNQMTVSNARRWIFLHPDDEAVVDAFALHEPRHIEMIAPDNDFIEWGERLRADPEPNLPT
ncbi:hypothetical protein GALL_233260 [mine drainage metagenome]|uniref:DUF4238 domain-containing protein n=1 Tax=mine drainage metagenome TaxID=410659 RepID=A0A1J5RRF3_9ZZZZ